MACRAHFLAAIVAGLVAAVAGPVRGQGFGVATWNLAWLMDSSTHARWATACERLAGDEGLQARLRADPSGVAEFLEDTLRDDGPFQFHYRYAPQDTSLGGVAIPAGSRVLMMWAAANRPAPGAPDVPADGPQPPHYAFGKGMHFCIGAPIARLEARLAIEQLLARTASIALVPDDPATRRPSIFLRRFARLPLVLTPV